LATLDFCFVFDRLPSGAPAPPAGGPLWQRDASKGDLHPQRVFKKTRNSRDAPERAPAGHSFFYLIQKKKSFHMKKSPGR